MELVLKIVVGGWQLPKFAKSFILDICQGSERVLTRFQSCMIWLLPFLFGLYIKYLTKTRERFSEEVYCCNYIYCYLNQWKLLYISENYTITIRRIWKQTFCLQKHGMCSIKKEVLKNFTNLQENTCLFLKRLLKVRLRHCCFPVNFTKFLLTTVLQNICEGLLLCFFFFY